MSGDSWDDNITDDGSYETTGFKISVVDGVTRLTATDDGGHETIMYKE